MSLAREYWVEDNDEAVMRRSAYRELFKTVALNMGAENETYESDVDDVMKFEKSLANITLPREKSRNISEYYFIQKFSEFQNATPSITWSKLTEIHMKEKISDDSEVAVIEPGFFKGLERILTDSNPRIITNYIMWRIVIESIPLLAESFSKPFKDYKRKIFGIHHEAPRWKKCLSSARSNFQIATSSAFVKDHFDPQDKHVVSQMLRYIMRETEDQLKKNQWMDHETRMKALQKSKSMAFEIGYPKQLLDEKELKRFHEKVYTSSSCCLLSFLHLT